MLTFHVQGEAGYEDALAQLARRGDADLERVEESVRAILAAVRDRGDEAIRELTEKFEQRRQEHVRLPEALWRAQAKEAPAEVREALAAAAERIRRYHEHQREPGFRYEEEGVELGQRVLPVKAAGVYAPGGKARYPSTVLMTAVPAAVAGVPRIVLATPRPTPEILAAAEVAGVTEVIDAGGAQAIGALAYGTASVGRVDKIVGPGNLYVACAKRLVFGLVDIDSIAGPSEILVVADDAADPEVVAADLLSQAEHDEDAYPLLVTLSRAQAEAVDAAVARQLADLPREAIARQSVEDNGHCFVVEDRAEAARVADALAAEHLNLSVEDPDAMLEGIGAVGAAFLGYHTPEAAGDYAAGPSHVLPTGGAARFASPLGVYDFVVRTSLIRYSKEAIRAQADLLEGLARLEGLEAHARAVKARR
ncbi:MAG TPA: histidinol dehydrogenase [Polyangiaceae bacterium LLY-WYZ-15_(1-7)]|nr:histidinol dehydrogenase [Myxococcales bacterium]MAT29631.1 histidinol dehydrogenase [Sandaracinus sp.]HJK99844.1 histidinol dehydrogenase [Polyangiaceae bacterium LLY-WYZ-15_(1-7)]HJL11370.1 histidinol dehydrogenase [Polyangiaceae bacterium LLY-WYZ-15_(1-7)]HJL45303.1 histidinol dehydrogenase [Polyangiaceae bacterium LLY-WYZ-15_(1-7)]